MHLIALLLVSGPTRENISSTWCPCHIVQEHQFSNHARTHSFVYFATVVGSAIEAGTDTPTSTILFFLLAAVLYPDAYLKAQQEIDSVVGTDGSTIPTFANVDDLPYCFAYAKEVLRYVFGA